MKLKEVKDSYCGEPPLKGKKKILPAGGKDNSRKDAGLTERIYHKPPEPPPLKVAVKSPFAPISPEKKFELWNDQGGHSENIRKKTEIIHYNPPDPPSVKVEIKSPSVPISPEKKHNKLWNDQRCDSERIRKKLDEVLSQTTGMASLTACAHLLGMRIFLRSTSNKECLNMAEGILEAIVDGIKEAAEKKDIEIPSIKIKLEVG